MKHMQNCLSFSRKNLECEICKKAYPSAVLVDDNLIDLIEIPRPMAAYLIMETLSVDKNESKVMFMVSMANKENVRLGRGHESDVRISDISVSRCHAMIKLKDDKFILEDNSSKFGTLI